jgi:hypothetical protein
LFAAVLPGLVGILLGASVVVGRPLLQRWRSQGASSLTLVWALGLLVAGALQAFGAVSGTESMFDPIGFLSRTAVALAVEALLLGVSVFWWR